MKTTMMRHWQRLVTTACVLSLFGTACDDTPTGGLPNQLQPDVGVAELVFLAPTADSELGLDDDADGDLSNGLQYEVRVALNGVDALPEEAAVILVVDGGTPLTGTLEVLGGEGMPMDGPAGVAVFPVTLEEPGEHRLEVSMAIGDSMLRDEVNITVAVAQCSLVVSPAPGGGACDLGPDADLDPETDGIQTTLTAETDCSRVRFVVNNLPAIDVAVTDGTASTEVTLRDGENSVEVTAEGGGSANAVGPYPLTVSGSAPRIELDGMSSARENIHLLADGVTQEGRTYWRMTGNTSGLPAGGVVNFDFAPAIPGAPAMAVVSEDGDFAVELSLAAETFYTGTLTVRGTDACGVTGASATYRVRFDSVTSRLRIEGPADGSLIALPDDIGPNRAGIQIPITVTVTDPRPEDVDYRLTVECAPVSNEPVFSDRTREAADAVYRSHLADLDPNNDQVIATFLVTESGEYICRATASGDINPPSSIAVAWRVFFNRPTFTILSPEAVPGCNSGNVVEVSGFGEQLEGNDPNLRLVITPDGAEPLPSVDLNPLGQQRYGRVFNGDELAEGSYRLAVSGEVFGRVPIEVLPNGLDINIDRTPPELRFLSPGIDGELLDEDPSTQGTQVRVRVSVCGAPGQMVTVATSPAIGQPLQGMVPADDDCGVVELPLLTVPLGDIEFSARVTDACGFEAQESHVAAIPEADVLVRMIEPVDGSNINADDDTDANRRGCQFTVLTLSRGFTEENPLAVCTNLQQGAADALCGSGRSVSSNGCNLISSGPEGSAFECAVSVETGDHLLTFVRRARGETVTSPAVQVRADCSAPSLTSISVVEDEDENGCIHRQERRNASDVGGDARVTVGVATDGMDDGETLRVRLDDGSANGVALGSGAVANDMVQIQVSLSEGTHRLFVRGRDGVGNALPEPGDEGGPEYLEVRVDTTPPNPSVLNLVDDTCLNAGDNIDPDGGNLQYALQVQTGRDGDELVTGQLSVDNVVVAETTDAVDRFDFPALTLDEGDRQIRGLVTDTCGNIGSIAGFDLIAGQPNWARPLSISTRVDSVAPGLTLGGLAEGQVLEPGDDADGDSANGFQADASVTVDAAAGLEAGQTIEILSDGAPVSTSPNPLTATGNANPLAARLTVPPGQQSIVARAVDQCGNIGTSNTVAIEVLVDGCRSEITNLPGAVTVLGAGDGNRNGDTLAIEVVGSVDLLDDQCLGANVELIVDDVVVQRSVVGAGGAVRFPDTALQRGARAIRLRVGPVRGDKTAESASEQVLVDLAQPTVRFLQPAEGSVVVSDSSGQPGQQVTVLAEVVEAGVDSARTATIRVDGNLVGNPVDVGGGETEQVNFLDLTMTSGAHTVEICATDLAESTGCSQLQFTTDPSAPAGVSGLTATIVNRRSTEVRLDFTAPGDDGAGGDAVVEYEVRSASQSMNAAGWDNAVNTALIVPNESQPGADTSLTISGAGPGPDLSDGLALNALHFVAVRARDDAGQLGAIVEVEVDLRFSQASFQFPNPTVGEWSNGDLANSTSPVIGLGDINNDGFDDVLVTAVQQLGEVQSAVVLGAEDPQNGVVQLLELPADREYAYFGIGASATGDINGDGAPDFAVIGYTTNFSHSEVAIYFGCDRCAAGQIGTPDVLIVSATLSATVAGVGEFTRPAGDQGSFNDILLGGDFSNGYAYVVPGRATWPLLADDEVLTLNADVPAGNDVTALEVPEGRAGIYAARAGDLDGDGFDEVVFSAGGGINSVYVFNGGAALPELITYDGANPRTTPVTDPCPGQNASFGTYLAGGFNLDGDAEGRPDLLVSNRANKRISVFDHTLENIDCFGRSPQQFGKFFDLAGDVDGDGEIDLVASHVSPDTNAYIFYNDGSGHFGVGDGPAARGYHALLATPVARKQGVGGIGDFNRDNRADIGAVIKQAGNGPVELVIYY